MFNFLKNIFNKKEISPYPGPSCKYLVSHIKNGMYYFFEITKPECDSIGTIYYYLCNKYPNCNITNIWCLIK